MTGVVVDCPKCGTAMPRKVCPSCGWERVGGLEQALRVALVLALAVVAVVAVVVIFGIVTS